MNNWQWDYALTPTPDHWIFEFILEKVTGGKLLGEHFKFRETLHYPRIPIIEIFRVYEDKFARFHYFSFSSKAVVDQFLDQRLTFQIKSVKTKQNNKFPRCKIQEIGCGTHTVNKIIYCLPSTHINKRSPA